MSNVMNIRSGIRATLLALAFLCVGISLPRMYSSIRTFFLESLPSILSAAMAPKCLFVFSNIIVVFLVSESKLSRRRGKLLNTDNIPHAIDKGMLLERKDDEGVMAVTEALLPMLTGENNQEQEDNMVMLADEDKRSSVCNRGLQMLDQCVDELDHLHLHEVYEVDREVEDDEGEVEPTIREGLGREEEQECTGMQELQEMDLPPADELNRRVEDFIARFNMERQLEAKMLVACY